MKLQATAVSDSQSLTMALFIKVVEKVTYFLRVSSKFDVFCVLLYEKTYSQQKMNLFLQSFFRFQISIMYVSFHCSDKTF